jgi:hypothetical protein
MMYQKEWHFSPHQKLWLKGEKEEPDCGSVTAGIVSTLAFLPSFKLKVRKLWRQIAWQHNVPSCNASLYSYRICLQNLFLEQVDIF